MDLFSKSVVEFIKPYVVDQYEVFNQNPNLLEFRIPKNHQDWHTFRHYGIGASEIGAVVGVNPYVILPELVEQKVGTRPSFKDTNESMLSGLLAESIILTRWKGYDGTELGYVENVMKMLASGEKEGVVRTAHIVDSYIINIKYPFLFVSLDARTDANQFSLTGEFIPYEFPIEMKTIRHYYAAKWDQGIPAMYRYQVQQQMLVTEVDYAELAVLEDGVNFKVYPFQKDEKMQEIILTRGEETMSLIYKLRGMKEEMDYYLDKGDLVQANKIKQLYDNELPLPMDEEAAKEYYSSKMQVEKDVFIGTDIDLKNISERVLYAEILKRVDKLKQGAENPLMRSFTLAKAEYMDLGEHGKLRYFKKEGGKNFQFDFKGVKNLLDENTVEEIIKKVSRS